MYTYDRLFTGYNHVVAQILLTGADFEQRERRENLENTMFRLLELGAIPIINENDTIATEEIAVGDNDTLGAIVANCVQSDLLVILSDIDGLYTADPRADKNARFISVVEEITPEIEALAGASGSSLGTGGMTTKLHAAHIAMRAGFDMVIANGSRPEILYDIVDGKRVGTRFVGRKPAQEKGERQ
jgi:glutamate 5-kinase